MRPVPSRLVVVCLALAVAAGLAGCSDSPDDPDDAGGDAGDDTGGDPGYGLNPIPMAPAAAPVFTINP